MAVELLEDRRLLSLWIVDNGDPGYAQTGPWTYYGRGGYGGDLAYARPDGGAAVATWTFTVPVGFEYQVAATWLQYPNRATDAPYTVSSAGLQWTVDVNQELAPDDFSDAGADWEILGTFPVDAATLTIELSDEADQLVIADAIRVEQKDPLPPVRVIETGQSTDVTEDGATDTYAIVLREQPGPSQTVVVDISADAAQLGVSAGSVQFTDVDWDTPKTVTVSAVDDSLEEADHTSDVTHSVRAGSGAPFEASGVDAVTVHITDNEPASLQIIDDGDPGYATTGTWLYYGARGYGGDFDYVPYGDPETDTATWTFEVLPGQIYRVAATWVSASNRSPGADYTVSTGTLHSSLELNQRLAPNDFSDAGVLWETLGDFGTASDSLAVEVVADSGYYVAADAIRIERLGPIPATQIVDDQDPPFATVGSWLTWPTDGYLDRFRYSPAGDGSNVAMWSFAVEPGFSYEVFATWYPHRNRATNAPFTIDNGSEATTVRVDQELAPDDLAADGGVWESLGTFAADGRTLVVSLSDLGDQIVVADAVRVVKSAELPPVRIVESDGSTDVAEGGASDTYEVLLRKAPSAGTTVTVNVSPDAQVSTDKTSVVFDDANWNVPQTVTVAAVNDALEEDYLHTGTIAHAVDTTPPGRDTSFDGAPVDSVVAAVTDNDTPGPQVLIVDDGDAAYSTSGDWVPYNNGYQYDLDYTLRGGPSDVATWTFDVVPGWRYQVAATWLEEVNRSPQATYTVQNGADEWTVHLDQRQAPAGVTDNGANWTVLGEFGLEDSVLGVELEGDPSALVVADAIRIERLAALPPVKVDLLDGSIEVIEGGATDTYEVVLREAPSADVIVNMSTGGEVAVGPTTSLTFTTGNWGTPQTVTVTAVDDSVEEGDHGDTITHNTSSADTDFDGITIALAAGVTDDDLLGPFVQITDDGDAGFSTVGTWQLNSSAGHNGDFVYSTSGTGADTASWAFTVVPDWTYEVRATWVEYFNRAADAPFSVSAGVNQFTSLVDQRAEPSGISDAGSVFQLLGSIDVPAGVTQLTVQLSDDANGLVVADAIRIERTGMAPGPGGAAVHDDVLATLSGTAAAGPTEAELRALVAGYPAGKITPRPAQEREVDSVITAEPWWLGP